MTLLPDGKFLAAGYARTTNTDAKIVRFNSDGSIDASFANNGIATFGNTSNEIFWDVHVKGGKIIATGNRSLSSPGSPDDFMIVRFSLDGVLDTTFGASGVTYTDFGTSRDISLTSAFQPNGKLVLAGYSTGSSIFNRLVRDSTSHRVITTAMVDRHRLSDDERRRQSNRILVSSVISKSSDTIYQVGNATDRRGSSRAPGRWLQQPIGFKRVDFRRFPLQNH